MDNNQPKPTLVAEDFLIAGDEATACALLHIVRHPRYPIGLLGILGQDDARDFAIMRQYAWREARGYMSPRDKACGYYTPIAMDYLEVAP